ncbi:uncharacterized protein LOC144548598 isoform X2 [Carex rostrata]
MFQPSDMDMLGIDLGNWTCLLIHKEYSRCKILRDFEFPWVRTNVKTQISQIKCLLGRKFSDPELQLELSYIPFRVIEGPDGYPLVHSRCKGEDRAFTPVEILAMLISSPQFVPNNHSPTCIGIPMYFTDQQKMDVLQAANLAGLSNSFYHLDEAKALLLAHETLLGPPRIVAFVDIGHANIQICFAEFKRDIGLSEKKRSMNILYKGYARSLGGREFDKVLFKHFASTIRKEYNIDVFESSSACVRLSEACEILKKDLSINNKASFCIENFSGSIDVKVSITRKEFETLGISILKRIEVALKKALSESGLDVDKIELIEAIGKGCSIPAIIDILTKIFGEKVRIPTCNDYIAKGCAMKQARQRLDKMTKDQTTDPETSQLVSSVLNSEEKKMEDSEFLWRRAMDEDGHLLTFLNEFLEENMHRIGRSEKTKDESYWLSKANYYAKYRYSELQDATNNFHESLKLGEGGFGIVYKGNLRKYKTVAIKILKEGSSRAREFNQEVETLSKVRHPNLVKLIGACAETRALIYEYLPNGSLEDRLRCKNNTLPLPWQARVRIAFEICSALSFLHCSEPHGIVHGDLKPDNILLDGNNTSKICDFGLCRELNWTASASVPYHWTDCPKGTFAYMDPEYFSTGKITPQFDVYSFGILLLRLGTCKNPRGIRQLVEEALRKGTLKALIDPSAGPWPFKEAKKMISLGLRCSDPVRKNRPDLSKKVWKELKSMADVASASMFIVESSLSS